jgi:hypothetical protein
MLEKYKLNLAVGLTILLIAVWLISAGRVWDWEGQLLLLVAVVLIIKTLITREKKPAKLLEFFIKGLIVSYIATCIFWFARLIIESPGYLAYLNLELLMNILILNVLPLSLLPVAVAVTVYGIFKIKLRAWEFFLSSWYVTVFVVFAVYELWESIYVRPYLPEFYYSSIAGAIALALGLALLSFLIAGILTIIYTILKRKKIEPPA